MRMGRPVPDLVLTMEEQQTLLRWARWTNLAQALAQRAGAGLRAGEVQHRCEPRDGRDDEDDGEAAKPVCGSSARGFAGRASARSPAPGGCTTEHGGVEGRSPPLSVCAEASCQASRVDKSGQRHLGQRCPLCERTSDSGH